MVRPPSLQVVLNELAEHVFKVATTEDLSVHHPVRDDHKPPA